MEDYIIFESVFGNSIKIPKKSCYKYVDKISAKTKRYFVEHFSFDGPCYKKEVSEIEYKNIVCKSVG